HRAIQTYPALQRPGTSTALRRSNWPMEFQKRDSQDQEASLLPGKGKAAGRRTFTGTLLSIIRRGKSGMCSTMQKIMREISWEILPLPVESTCVPQKKIFLCFS